MKNYLTIKFPTVNKNNTLVENDKRISQDFLCETCEIIKTLSVPDSIYTALGESLLYDNDIWERIGGQILVNEEWITLVICVENAKTGEKFYVNTERYKYARYVGR